MNRKAPTTYAPLFTFLGTGPDSVVADGEIVVVNFAGLGGACAGIEDALHRPVTHAINHDPVAISLHRTNNPHTIHHVQDVWAVDPAEVADGRRIALAWFSPDCKHFSKAKGGKPREKNIRDLAWVTTKYTGLPDHLKPRVVFLENVEEFKTWGPLDEQGQPDKVRQGETFREFVATIEAHGYQVEWRELRACDYGAPTIRKRLFLIARCDGQPIVWPQPTHGKPDSAAVRSGQLKPWRTAAECIDWNLPTPSIFERRRPLVEATLRRVARGIKKFVLETEQPFIVKLSNGDGQRFRGQEITEPLHTITATKEHAVLQPVLAPLVTNKQHQAPSRSALQPLSTITTNHNKNELVTGVLVPRLTERKGQLPRAVDVQVPAPTVTTTANGHRLTTFKLVKNQQGDLTTGVLVGVGGRGAQTRPKGMGEPMHTVTSKADMALTAVNLIHFYGTKNPDEVRGQEMGYPLKTQTTENRHGLVTANLLRIDMRGFDKTGVAAVAAPLNTIHTKQAQAITTASLIKHFGGYYQGAGSPANEPSSTITANDHNGLLISNLLQYNGTADAQAAKQPIPTISTVERFGLTCTALTRQFDAEGLSRARQVYELLAQYAPEALSGESHALGVVLTSVAGEQYIIADIGMRMLTPRELARCQGFRDTYVLEHTAEGKPVSKAAQVRGVGNSVCPPIARALVAAQFAVQEAAD